MSRVAVLVPVGGFAPFLPEALDGLPDGVDVVVIDDAADPPVPGATVRRDVRGGPAAARATGAVHVPDAEYLALCDADDAWLPGKLDPQIAALDADPSIGLVFGRAEIIGIDGRPTGETWDAPPAGPLDPAALYRANPIPTSSVVLRRSALEAAGGFDAPVFVAEDWDLWLRVAAAGFGVVCVPEAGIRYRRHPGSLTSDVARLAAAQLVVHERHASLVSPTVSGIVIDDDRRTLRRARLRERIPFAGLRDPYR